MDQPSAARFQTPEDDDLAIDVDGVHNEDRNPGDAEQVSEGHAMVFDDIQMPEPGHEQDRSVADTSDGDAVTVDAGSAEGSPLSTGAADSTAAGRTVEDQMVVVRRVLDQALGAVVSTDPDFYEQLADVLRNLGTLGQDVQEYLESLDEEQKLRLEMLKHEMALGLPDHQLPYGTALASNVTPTAFWAIGERSFAQSLMRLQAILTVLGEGSNDPVAYNETLSEGYSLLQSLRAQNLEPRRLARDETQGRGWFVLINHDPAKPNDLDARLAVHAMRHILAGHQETIEQLAACHADDGHGKPPYLKPLLADVNRFIKELRVPVDALPERLTDEEREVMRRFMPALAETLNDRVNALVGGESYLPLQGKLKEIQDRIGNAPTLRQVHDAGCMLEPGMQRLFVVHTVAENLIAHIVDRDPKLKSKVDKPGTKARIVTAGIGVSLMTKQYPDLLDPLEVLMKAIQFRNTVAHGGIIYSPEQFPKAIAAYEEGIAVLEARFEVSIDALKPEKPKISYDERPFKERLFNMLSIKDPSVTPEIANKWLESWGVSRAIKDMLDAGDDKGALEDVLNRRLNIIYQNRFGKEVFNSNYRDIRAALTQLRYSRDPSLNPEIEKDREKARKGLYRAALKYWDGTLDQDVEAQEVVAEVREALARKQGAAAP